MWSTFNLRFISRFGRSYKDFTLPFTLSLSITFTSLSHFHLSLSLLYLSPSLYLSFYLSFSLSSLYHSLAYLMDVFVLVISRKYTSYILELFCFYIIINILVNYCLNFSYACNIYFRLRFVFFKPMFCESKMLPLMRIDWNRHTKSESKSDYCTSENFETTE